MKIELYFNGNFGKVEAWAKDLETDEKYRVDLETIGKIVKDYFLNSEVNPVFLTWKPRAHYRTLALKPYKPTECEHCGVVQKKEHTAYCEKCGELMLARI